jgi:hypothetical protein
MLPFRLITGMNLPLPIATWFFATLGFLASTGILLKLRSQYFTSISTTTVLMLVFVLALATPMIGLLIRSEMWEFPIIGGYCFAMISLGCALICLHTPLRRSEWAVATGLFLGFAIASRPIYLFASIFFAAPLYSWWKEDGRLPWRSAIAFVMPLLVIGIMMMWHNFARFDNPFEFGQAYQFSSDIEAKNTHFALRFIPYNLHAYFLQTAEWFPYFPFIKGAEFGVAPEGYTIHREEVFSIINHYPVICLALLAPLALWNRSAVEGSKLAAWLLAVTLFLVGTAAVLLSFFSALPRYQFEIHQILLLIACIGLLSVERWAKLFQNVHGQRIISIIINTASALSIGFGILFFLQYDSIFLTKNRIAAKSITRFMNYFPVMIAEKLGYFRGPIELNLRIKFPNPPPIGQRQPLVVTGKSGAGDLLSIEFINNDEVRFALDHWGKPLIMSRSVKLDPKKAHTIDIKMASSISLEDAALWVNDKNGIVHIVVDGVTIWDKVTELYVTHQDDLWVGKNPIGGTTCGEFFTGEITRVLT